MEETNLEAATAKKKGGNVVAPRPSSASLPFGGAAVVVGGGVAGTAAAAELCSRRPDARVTLVARDNKIKVPIVFIERKWETREREARGREKVGELNTSTKPSGKKRKNEKKQVATNVVRHTKYIETFDSECL